MGNVFHVELGPTPSRPGPYSFDSAEILDELSRILGSEAFRASESHKNFLRYTVEQTLAGHGGDIKEYSVATKALGKENSFDPRLDPIVRMQATKLRIRLARYYATEGASDPLRIELPRGSYSPIFVPPVSLSPVEEAGTGKVSPSGKDSHHSEYAEKTDLAPVAIPAHEPDAALRRPSSRLAVFGIAAVLVCAAAAVGGWSFSKRKPVVTPVSRASIVITPFKNLSDSREDDYFSDGLTDELISSMARLKSVRVIGRTSAFQFKDKAIDIREIGRRLNVATVLQGTVRRYNGRVRVTAQLSDSAQGAVLWSQIYEQEATDAVSIQSAIANAITAELGVHLAGKDGVPGQAFAENPGTANHQAYEAYLKGRYFCGKRKTPKTVPMAIEYYEQALKLDSAYAAAWAGIADCYAVAPGVLGEPYTEVTPKIEAAAHRAISLDANIGQAYIDLGVASMFTWDWSVAEANFLKGISLTPNDPSAHHWYSTFLLMTGRVHEAIQQSELALSLDPISPAMAAGLGRALRYDGQLDAAIAQLKKGLVLDPNFGTTRQELTMAYLQAHRYADATAESKKAVEAMDNTPQPSSRAQAAFAYAQGGHPQEARAILNGILPLANSGQFPPSIIAAIYFGLGDMDNTFRWFQKAIETHAGTIFLKADPIYDPLRSDPRFPGLLSKMNLGDSGISSAPATSTKH